MGIIDDDNKENTSPPSSANKKRTRKMFDDQCKQDTITRIPSPPNKKQKISKETTPSTSAFADFFKERARNFTAKKVTKPLKPTTKTTCITKPKIEEIEEEKYSTSHRAKSTTNQAYFV